MTNPWGWLPASRNQLAQLKEQLMTHVDDVLHKLADKLDAAADRITKELDRLEAEAKRGRPSGEVIRRVRQSVDALHNIVPEAEAEEEAEAGEGDEDQPELPVDDEHKGHSG